MAQMLAPNDIWCADFKACPDRQSFHIAQVLVVAVQFLGDVIRWPCA